VIVADDQAVERRPAGNADRITLVQPRDHVTDDGRAAVHGVSLAHHAGPVHGDVRDRADRIVGENSGRRTVVAGPCRVLNLQEYRGRVVAVTLDLRDRNARRCHIVVLGGRIAVVLAVGGNDVGDEVDPHIVGSVNIAVADTTDEVVADADIAGQPLRGVDRVRTRRAVVGRQQNVVIKVAVGTAVVGVAGIQAVRDRRGREATARGRDDRRIVVDRHRKAAGAGAAVRVRDRHANCEAEIVLVRRLRTVVHAIGIMAWM